MLGVGKARYLLGLASLASGVALLVYFLAGISLALSACFTLLIAIGCAYFVWQRLPNQGHKEVLRRARVGLWSGLLATAGYDLSRFLLVSVADLSIRPFETFKLFGQLLVGTDASLLTLIVVGTSYHLVNGLSFALAYTMLFGYKGWKAGVMWAMLLELLMVSFYPGWLGLKALDEFLSVTIFGHVVYGSLLGWSSCILLQRLENEPSGVSE